MLYKHLKALNKNTVLIKSLKLDYTPIELASQLDKLIEVGFLKVDWKKRLIHMNDYETEHLVSKRNILGEFNNDKPDYMSGDKIEINKPII